jgi:hypothetical protein
MKGGTEAILERIKLSAALEVLELQVKKLLRVGILR